MVGRVVEPHYRRRRNLLSISDYTRAPKIYSRIRVQAIVVFATGPYHACVVRRNKFVHQRGSPSMNIVAMVLAGGEGTRLQPLTAEQPKPAVPFANGYRLVDFVLSNLVNSRISTIYVLAQYKPEALVKHVQSAWAPWFADGEGTINTLLPRSNTLGGQFKGTADAVYQYLDILQAHSPDMVAVFAADHVYRMDVRQMVAFHRERRADVTVAAVGVPLAQASHFGVLGTAPDGRISEFREKPQRAPAMPWTRPAPTPRWAITCLIPKSWRKRCSTRAAAATPTSAATCCPSSARAGACTPTILPRTGSPACRTTKSPATGATSARLPRWPPRSRTR